MCFSATASFSAAVVLTTIGVVSLKKTTHKRQMLFACIPFMFGVQQFSEGLLWLTIPKQDYFVLQKTATYVYLFFAHVLWPLWVPIAIMLMDQINERTFVQKTVVFIGISVSIFSAYCLLNFDVKSTIDGHHINYILEYSAIMNNFWIFLYALATIVPPFFSHIKRMWVLGITILISYFITQLFYENYTLSVWCFFSSIISVMIYYFIDKLSKYVQNSAINNNHYHNN